ncbi:DNA-directed RNA polymerase I subunit RPA2 [Frankliniella fusca]|uniref:DNA-directed RNA polymerase I subunit RPA2 n=1 Tax=Frankliniella fusca TaxID=407009 RepID=A0AAE1LEI8_9NEOP|nr:DNA-directed RNA polymerase I subunit RPA2 [Frankliniella fusca]
MEVVNESLHNGLDHGEGTSQNSQETWAEMSKESIVSAMLHAIQVVLSRSENLRCIHGQTCPTCIKRVAADCVQHFLLNKNEESISLYEPCPSPQQTAVLSDKIEVKEMKVVDQHCDPPLQSKKAEGGYCLRKFTKDVPDLFALCRRGAYCHLCGDIFKGLRCSDRLIAHVKKVHSRFATPKYLREVAQSATPKGIIGKGMLYCGCRKCSIL